MISNKSLHEIKTKIFIYTIFQRNAINKQIRIKMKKSQGLSINAIILAAIALIVLVVLVAIFTGRIGLFSKGISEVNTCKGLGGSCLTSCDFKDRVIGASDCGRDLTNEGGLNQVGLPYCCKT